MMHDGMPYDPIQGQSQGHDVDSSKFFDLQNLSPPPFIVGAGKWLRFLNHSKYLNNGLDIWYFSEFLCQMIMRIHWSHNVVNPQYSGVEHTPPVWANLCFLILRLEL